MRRFGLEAVLGLVLLAALVAGVLLGLWWRSRYGGSVPVTRSVARATVAEVGAVLLLCGWVWGIARWTMADPELAKATRWVGVYLPPCLLLVWVLARGGGWVSRVLKSAPVAYLGEISFALAC